MIIQLVALLGMTALFLRERRIYLDRKARERSQADVRAERKAREDTRPYGHVVASPINPPLAPIAPIAMARTRRQQADPRSAA